MKILTAQQLKQLETLTLQRQPINQDQLIERTAKQVVTWITTQLNITSDVNIISGSGKNGAHGVAVARNLHLKGYKVKLWLVKSVSSPALLSQLEKISALQDLPPLELRDAAQLKAIKPNEIIIDAMWDVGSNSQLEGLFAQVANQINQLTNLKIALDLPSGLLADQPISESAIVVKANYTLTFALPKLAMFFADNYQYCGDWFVIDIDLDQSALHGLSSNFLMLEKVQVIEILSKYPRRKFDHKGTYGHALIAAGSYGKMGAAILAAKGCLRSGVGLLTMHIPWIGFRVMQSSLPEVMVQSDQLKNTLSEIENLEKYSGIGIGPGIGNSEVTQHAFLEMLDKQQNPLVIDADGLNILAMHQSWYSQIPQQSILTPHLKEFNRCFGETVNWLERINMQSDYAKQLGINILLKGAYSLMALADGRMIFNSTGNPGLATAGSGDVLTGLITGLLAQGFSSEDALVVGVYVHGLAGDLAIREIGERGLIASDIANFIPKAFALLEAD